MIMKVIVFCGLACMLGAVSVAHAQYFRPQSTRCVNPNGRPGTCVSIYDCQTVLSVLQRNPLHDHDAAFVRASECFRGYGPGPYICCTSDTGFTRPSRSDFYPSQETGGFPQSTILFPASDNRLNSAPNTRLPSSSSAHLPLPPICGGVTIENKIYGGNDADPNEFPWMVLFEYDRRSGGTSVNCAGSLINERYVLTAAHCVTGAVQRRVGQLIAVRLGDHDLRNQFETVRIGIEALIPHEYYVDSSANKENDIALVRLDRNVRFSDNIRPICLASVVQDDPARSSSQYTVAGWGRTLESVKSVVKQKLNVALVDQEQCREKFRERKVNIVDTQLCAGGKFAEDSCEGDSGGPLMRFRGGVWVLEGVVSFGFKCGLRNWPAVHTRISSYDDWIRRNLRA